jgi:hypothetical protein
MYETLAKSVGADPNIDQTDRTHNGSTLYHLSAPQEDVRRPVVME